MPTYRTQNPWGRAASGGGGAVGDIGTVFNTIQKAKLLQAQQQYQRRLQEAHSQLFMSQANLADQNAEKVAQDVAKSRSIMDLANVVGKSQEARAAVTSASLGDNPETLASAVNLLRSRNAAPQGAFNITRSDLDQLLSGLASGSAANVAATTPASAASLLEPTAVPEGAVAYNKLGDVAGMGQPKSTADKVTNVGGNLVDASGKVLFTAPKAPKTVSTAPGAVTSVVNDDGTITPAFTNKMHKPFALGNSTSTLLQPGSGLDQTNRAALANALAKEAFAQMLDRNSSDGAQVKFDSVSPSAMAAPTTDEEYNALPSGTKYKHPDGTVKIKP